MFGLSPLEELVLVSAVVFGLYWCGRAMRSLFRRLFGEIGLMCMTTFDWSRAVASVVSGHFTFATNT